MTKVSSGFNVFKGNLNDKSQKENRYDASQEIYNYEKNSKTSEMKAHQSETHSKKLFESFGQEKNKNQQKENQNYPMNGPSSSYYKRVHDVRDQISFHDMK
jgi:hypothetical protein